MDGNANAIKLCKDFVDGEPFAVLFGDDVMYVEDGEKPVTKQLIDAYYATNGASIVGCQRTSEEVARRCGVMITKAPIDEKTTLIEGIIEKPQAELPSALVSLGRFVLAPSIFEAIERTPYMHGEAYLTDSINILAKEKDVCAYEFCARRYDIGNKEGYLEATVEYALRDKDLDCEFKEYLRNITKEL